MLDCQIPKGMCNLWDWIKPMKEILTSGHQRKTMLTLASCHPCVFKLEIKAFIILWIICFTFSFLLKFWDLYWTCLSWKYPQLGNLSSYNLLCKANFGNCISEMGAFGQKFPLLQSCVSSAHSSLVRDSVKISTECIYSSNAEIIEIYLLVENI